MPRRSSRRRGGGRAASTTPAAAASGNDGSRCHQFGRLHPVWGAENNEEHRQELRTLASEDAKVHEAGEGVDERERVYDSERCVGSPEKFSRQAGQPVQGQDGETEQRE